MQEVILTFLFQPPMKRRQFLSAALAATGASLVSETLSAQNRRFGSPPSRLPVTVNQYTCGTLYGRDNIDFWTRLEEIRDAGIDGIEVMLSTGAEADAIGKRLADHGLAMHSIYVSGNLHDEATSKKEIARLLEIGEKAQSFGTSIMVYNPEAKSGKSDEELIRQSKSMNLLGAGLQTMGMTLAFHYHTTELEYGAREFHHVLRGTDPRNVSLCFEQHWSYRGCGNSQVAMFDHLELYADRSVEVHLRQSVDNIWSETFGDGDIDNKRLAAGCRNMQRGIPHVVLEQAPEGGTPKTMTPAEALRQSAEYVRTVFGWLVRT
jgi:inosose dehydratase